MRNVDKTQDGNISSLRAANDALLVLFSLSILLSTFLFLLHLMLICILLLRRRRGIELRDNNGRIDMSRADLVQGKGCFDGWLESVNDSTRRLYLRAQRSFTYFLALTFIRVLNMGMSPGLDYQLQYQGGCEDSIHRK